jgi:hypothetical protein
VAVSYRANAGTDAEDVGETMQRLFSNAGTETEWSEYGPITPVQNRVSKIRVGLRHSRVIITWAEGPKYIQSRIPNTRGLASSHRAGGRHG